MWPLKCFVFSTSRISVSTIMMCVRKADSLEESRDRFNEMADYLQDQDG